MVKIPAKHTETTMMMAQDTNYYFLIVTSANCNEIRSNSH